VGNGREVVVVLFVVVDTDTDTPLDSSSSSGAEGAELGLSRFFGAFFSLGRNTMLAMELETQMTVCEFKETVLKKGNQLVVGGDNNTTRLAFPGSPQHINLHSKHKKHRCISGTTST
jgi:hypothetical protein